MPCGKGRAQENGLIIDPRMRDDFLQARGVLPSWILQGHCNHSAMNPVGVFVSRCAVVCASALACASQPVVAAESPRPYVAPAKSGVNKDAMTMQECRDRLAAPKRERPPGDDPGVDKDAVCANMLGNDKAGRPPRPRHAKPASGP